MLRKRALSNSALMPEANQRSSVPEVDNARLSATDYCVGPLSSFRSRIDFVFTSGPPPEGERLGGRGLASKSYANWGRVGGASYAGDTP